MKHFDKLIRISRKMALAMLILAGALTLHSCEEDAPEFTHSAAELADSWVCTVIEGDAADGFEVKIEATSDKEFVIKNFHNLDDMTVSISGTSLSFGGALLDGAAEVSNGTGTISNGWITMRLSYDITTEEDKEHFEVELNKGKALSKKIVNAAQ